MISHEHKCIFVEIPKTGSTSIRRILGEPPKAHLNICQIQFDMERHWTRYGGLANRIAGSLYSLLPDRTRAIIGRRQFEEYYKFGFVRNPWDRVVSLYLRAESLQMRDRMSFDEFVDWIKYSSSTCVHPVPHHYQLDWLVDPHGNVLVDFIGRFETLAEDWQTISAAIGISRELPHSNRNPIGRMHYTEYYTLRTRRVIEQRFRRDIEYFEYTFGDERTESVARAA